MYEIRLLRNNRFLRWRTSRTPVHDRQPHGDGTRTWKTVARHYVRPSSAPSGARRLYTTTHNHSRREAAAA